MYTGSICRRLFSIYRLKIRGFAVEFFTVFGIFSQNLARFLSFISYPLVTVLHSELFENNLFELDISISKKHFSMVKQSQEDKFFGRL